MENAHTNKPSSFILTIVALIIGAALFKQVDFQTFKVKQPALAAVYLITLLGCGYIMVRNRKGQVEK